MNNISWLVADECSSFYRVRWRTSERNAEVIFDTQEFRFVHLTPTQSVQEIHEIHALIEHILSGRLQCMGT
jgi:hypothetical protein